MSTIHFTQDGGAGNAASEPAGTTLELGKAGKGKKAASAFRTISEVAEELGVQQHVLRFWETKFSQVKPLKRGGGRRYYRPEDVALLRKIHHLLYTEGYTIKGVQKLMRGQGKSQIVAAEGTAGQAVATPTVTQTQHASASPGREPKAAVTAPVAGAKEAGGGLSDKQRVILQAMLGDLKELRDAIKGTGEG